MLRQKTKQTVFSDTDKKKQEFQKTSKTTLLLLNVKFIHFNNYIVKIFLITNTLTTFYT
jgi:hypothetical protein